ncbi:hypothetical protein CRM90_15345 [Mycobacterium sp. ENV421]|nr:hypothetical protein CRM90_15345 [Mycobacterium sp. ENV421]
MIGLPASAAIAAAPGDATPAALTAGAVGLAAALGDSVAPAGLAAAAGTSSLTSGVESEPPVEVDGLAAARLRGALRPVPAFVEPLVDEFPLAWDEPVEDRPEPEPLEPPAPPVSAAATGRAADATPTPRATASTPTRPTQRAYPDDDISVWSVLCDRLRTVI